MKDVKRAQDLIGSDVYDQDGGKIGRVGNVYVDDATQQPEWVTVRTGMFGTRESFVPLQGASSKGENGINVGVTRDKVKDAPRIEAEQGHLSDSEGRDLYSYYGLQPGSTSPQRRDVPQQQQGEQDMSAEQASSEQSESGQMAAGTQASGTGSQTSDTQTSDTQASSNQASGSQASEKSSDTQMSSSQTSSESSETQMSGTGSSETASSQQTGERTRSGTATPQQRGQQRGTTGQHTTDSSAMPETITRSEERLRISTENVESGRVRVRKYVTTEHETVTIPITREEVRIEREQIPENEQRGMSSETKIGESEQEIVLHEERPVVNTESVPVERIRINTEKVTEEQTIEGDVRRERFDIDDETGKQHQQES